MELLGIREMEHQCFRDLSGGQKQRVLLGESAVCHKEAPVVRRARDRTGSAGDCRVLPVD